MPELPEVESVRLSLLRRVAGRKIVGVHLRRPAVVRGQRDDQALLVGMRVQGIERHGKQLLITAKPARGSAVSPPCVCVHLGMSGSLCYYAQQPDGFRKHTHVVWQLDDSGVIEFHDPRRFGGVWTFSDIETARSSRCGKLGPDALSISEGLLFSRLQKTRRPIKAALLDQSLIAGLGNIYVDEVLFLSQIHPQAVAARLSADQVRRLAKEIGPLLRRAIRAGGSTLRDYVNGEGSAGGYQSSHQVYGRAGQPCVACGTTLRSRVVGGRTTVFCGKCQRR